MAKKYCKKHDQYFMDHVLACPICVGEKFIKIPERGVINRPERKKKKFKRKK